MDNTSIWDFQTALGETIKEKYESLYVKVVEISNVIHRKTIWNKFSTIQPMESTVPIPKKKYRSIDDPWEKS